MWRRSCSLLFGVLAFCSANGQVSLIQASFDREDYKNVIAKADSVLALQEVTDPKFHQLLADSYYYAGDIQESLASYLNAIYYAGNTEGSLRVLLETHSHAGFCYRDLGLNKKALPHYRESLRLAHVLNDSIEIAIQYYNLATIYQASGDFQNAVTVLDSAYRIDILRKDTLALGFDLNLMSDLNLKLGNNAMALESAKESLSLMRPGDGNRNSRAIRKNGLGVVYMTLGNLDSAAYYLKEAEKELRIINDSNYLARNWIHQANLNHRLGDQDAALKLSQAALVFTEGKTNEVTIDATLSVIEIYIEMLLFQKANDLLKVNEDQCKELGILPQHMRNLLLQKKVNESLGYSIENQEVDKRIKELEEAMAIDENKIKMELVNLQYKFDKIEERNRQISDQKSQAQALADQRQQMLLWVLIVSGIAIAVLIGVFVIFRSRRLAREQQLLSEIDNLRVQIKSVFEGDTSAIDLDMDKFNQQISAPLTEREFEILNLAIGDLNNSQIAEQISVSINTVKFHLKKIYEKLGVSNRKQALEYVLRAK